MMLLLEQKWFENGTCVNGHKKNVTLCCKYLKAMTLILNVQYIQKHKWCRKMMNDLKMHRGVSMLHVLL